MGLTIVVEDENGRQLDRIDDTYNTLHHLLPTPEDKRFNVVGSIDWYGDTVFNYLQIQSFLEDWGRINDKLLKGNDTILMERIRKMAVQVASERHLYLKFIGD